MMIKVASRFLLIFIILIVSACAGPRPNATWEHAGVVVTAVKPGSAAAESGIQPGDRITGHQNSWGYVDVTSRKQLLGILDIRYNERRSIVFGTITASGERKFRGFWIEGDKTAGMEFESD